MATSVAAPASVAVGHPKTRYTRVAALGLLMMAATPVLFLVGGMLAGMDLGEVIAFMSGGIVVGLLGAGAIWRLGLLGRILGVVTSLVLTGALFWVAFGLGQPSSFLDFSGAAMFVVGFLMALPGSIASLIAHPRGHVAVEATTGEHRIMRGALVVVAAAMVLSGVLTLTTRGSVDAASAAGATPVVMQNFKFSPASYDGAAGENTKLLVHNSDAFMHNFAVPVLGIKAVNIPPGSEAVFTVTGDAGTYAIYCTLHSSDSTKDIPAEDDMAALLTLK